MRDFESERQRLFARRTFLLGGLQSAMFGGLIARMYYLQITEGARFATLAEENRISTQLVPPSRGLVLDRFGEKLALNEQNFRLMLVPEQVGPIEDMLAKLRAFVKIEEPALKRIRRDLKRNRPFNPLLIADNLNWQQAAAIEVRLPELPGVSIDVGQIRYYPDSLSTAHMLGYVGAVSESDLKADSDPLLSLPTVQVGKTGIEKLLEKDLRGRAGAVDLEVNAHGRTIRRIDERAGTPGRTATLTLDKMLQNYVQQRLMTERSAAAVVMDVHTGAIYAMASHPSFDANAFSRGIDQASYDGLIKDETNPLTNKAMAGLYSPGSTFKMVVALAGLEAGMVDASHTVSCMGAMQLGNHKFHCWKRGGHGTLDMVGALRESCDVYFYDIASKVGIDTIAAMARRLGLGSATGLDLPGEKGGLVPDRLWKEATKGERWQAGETLIVSIGQGFMLATPLQLAVMTARLAGGGTGVVPHIIKEVKGGQQEQTEWPSLGLRQRNLDIVMRAMNAVVNEKKGTAFGARIIDKGKEMGGKTGTSQVRRISMAERASGVISNENLPWRQRDHALFVGYAPASNPRFAVSVVVEHGGGGSSIAAPIARDILLEAQRLDPTAPTRSRLPVAEFIPPNPLNMPNSGASGPVEESD